MIKLTRFDGSEFAVNADLIKFVESTPDTIVTLTSDQKILVLETVEEVIAKVMEYKRNAAGEFPRKQNQNED
jgi:flagellar protein FlbD